jgi:hypothetical protein
LRKIPIDGATGTAGVGDDVSLVCTTDCWISEH